MLHPLNAMKASLSLVRSVSPFPLLQLARTGKITKTCLERILRDASPVKDSYYSDSRMGSKRATGVAAVLILITIACSFTYVGGANACPPMRCDNGTAKSPRCKKTQTMAECFAPITSVLFQKQFSEPPQVHYSLTHMDVLKFVPQSAAALLLGVSDKGFEMKFKCNEPSKCFGLDATWIACGP